jgi:hypothetical protein
MPFAKRLSGEGSRRPHDLREVIVFWSSERNSNILNHPNFVMNKPFRSVFDGLQPGGSGAGPTAKSYSPQLERELLTLQ